MTNERAICAEDNSGRMLSNRLEFTFSGPVSRTESATNHAEGHGRPGKRYGHVPAEPRCARLLDDFPPWSIVKMGFKQ